MEEIDAIDNGISQWDGEPRYAMTTNVSARVGYLNPRWNDKDQDTEVGLRKLEQWWVLRWAGGCVHNLKRKHLALGKKSSTHVKHFFLH